MCYSQDAAQYSAPLWCEGIELRRHLHVAPASTRLLLFREQQDPHRVAAELPAHVGGDLRELAEWRCAASAVWVVDIVRCDISPSEVHGDDAFTSRNPRQVTRPSLEVLNSAELCAIAGETRG